MSEPKIKVRKRGGSGTGVAKDTSYIPPDEYPTTLNGTSGPISAFTISSKVSALDEYEYEPVSSSSFVIGDEPAIPGRLHVNTRQFSRSVAS